MSKESLAVQASKMPIFKMFGFIKSVSAVVKAGEDKSIVSFYDGSSFIFNKNGDVLFSFFVSSVKAFSQYPFEWVFAKNENQAIEIFRKKHGISVFCELEAACSF
jgi:hypothetical protein